MALRFLLKVTHDGTFSQVNNVEVFSPGDADRVFANGIPPNVAAFGIQVTNADTIIARKIQVSADPPVQVGVVNRYNLELDNGVVIGTFDKQVIA